VAKTIGSLVAVCTRETKSREGVREVISQAAPTFCIQVPKLETSAASQSVRKTGVRNGLQAEEADAGASVILAWARVPDKSGPSASFRLEVLGDRVYGPSAPHATIRHLAQGHEPRFLPEPRD
jgi:hypothetical protein